MTGWLVLTLLLAAGAGRQAPQATPEEQAWRRYERRPVRLDDAQLEAARREVLTRCRLPVDTRDARAPWYYHYELGQELAKRGDPQRALDAYVEAALRRASPERHARLYGMWFTNYRPYYEIARSHARLENWACARSALEVSARYGEVGPGDPDFQEFQALAKRVADHRQ